MNVKSTTVDVLICVSIKKELLNVNVMKDMLQGTPGVADILTFSIFLQGSLSDLIQFLSTESP